jgi:hypothetical protein
MRTHRHHQTPPPKIPEALEAMVQAAPKTPDEQIDRQMKDSFPASDPPSFSGGRHAIGAPAERESVSPTPDTPEVKAAEKKVKDGKTSPETY